MSCENGLDVNAKYCKADYFVWGIGLTFLHPSAKLHDKTFYVLSQTTSPKTMHKSALFNTKPINFKKDGTSRILWFIKFQQVFKLLPRRCQTLTSAKVSNCAMAKFGQSKIRFHVQLLGEWKNIFFPLHQSFPHHDPTCNEFPLPILQEAKERLSQTHFDRIEGYQQEAACIISLLQWMDI